jgi:hypothetical protein
MMIKDNHILDGRWSPGESSGGISVSVNRVRMVDLMEKQRWDVSAGNNKVLVVGPTLFEVGGRVESMQAFVRLYDAHANFRFKLTTEISHDGVAWHPGADLSVYWNAEISPEAGSYRVETPVTSEASVGRHVRFLFHFSSTSGAAFANISISVAVKFVGQ